MAKISTRVIGVILLIIGVAFVANSGLLAGAIICQPGQCGPNTHLVNIQYGATVMGTSTTDPIIVSMIPATITVNYFVPTGENLQSWSMVWCSSLTSGDACPSGSSSVPLTNNGKSLSGSWTAPSYASSTGGFFFFYVQLTDSQGFTAKGYGSVQFAPGYPTSSVQVTSSPSGVVVDLFQGSTEVASITTNGGGPVVIPSLTYGSYSWSANKSGYEFTTGSFTLTSAGYVLAITMTSNSQSATTSTVTNTSTFTTTSNGVCTYTATSVIVVQGGASSTMISGPVSCSFPTGSSSTTTSTSSGSSGGHSSAEGTNLLIGIVFIFAGFALIVSKKKTVQA